MGKQSRLRRERSQQQRTVNQHSNDGKRTFVLYAIAGIVSLMVLGIIGAAVIVKSQSADPLESPIASEIDPTAQIPRYTFPAGSPYEFGVTYYDPPANVPTVVLWEDYQCPGCAAFETSLGDTIKQLSREGKAKFIYRVASFLDENIGGDGSKNATAAWGCALDVNKGEEYHSALYASQPPTEGVGWTKEELIQLGVTVGMNEADFNNFRKCVDAGVYLPWANNITRTFYSSGVQGTPTALLNGQMMDRATLMDPVKFAAAIEAATQPVPSSSPAAPSTPATSNAEPSASPS